MNRLKQVLLAAMIMLSSNLSFSQTQDSLSRKAMAYVADKFPIARVLNIEYNQVTPYKYKPTYLGNDLPKGKIENMYQLKTSANINLIKRKKWILGTTLTYRYVSMNSESDNLPTGFGSYQDGNFHYHSESLNLTYFSKLFGKTAIYTGSLIADGSDVKFYERMRGMLSGTVVLKATAETQMTVGLIAFVDPSALFPVFPSFTYKHKFGNGWTTDVILPQGVFMRKDVASNGRLSVGSELGTTFFYLHNLDNTGNTYSFNQVEINSGFTYEHYLGRSFIATFKTGLRSVPNSRVFEKSSRQSDHIFKSSPEAAFYFNAGISFNPFGKKAKR